LGNGGGWVGPAKLWTSIIPIISFLQAVLQVFAKFMGYYGRLPYGAAGKYGWIAVRQCVAWGGMHAGVGAGLWPAEFYSMKSFWPG
jgi:hypothetical protein